MHSVPLFEYSLSTLVTITHTDCSRLPLGKCTELKRAGAGSSMTSRQNMVDPCRTALLAITEGIFIVYPRNQDIQSRTVFFLLRIAGL